LKWRAARGGALLSELIQNRKRRAAAALIPSQGPQPKNPQQPFSDIDLEQPLAFRKNESTVQSDSSIDQNPRQFLAKGVMPLTRAGKQPSLEVPR
jgi:hypothetical protein